MAKSKASMARDIPASTITPDTRRAETFLVDRSSPDYQNAVHNDLLPLDPTVPKSGVFDADEENPEHEKLETPEQEELEEVSERGYDIDEFNAGLCAAKHDAIHNAVMHDN